MLIAKTNNGEVFEFKFDSKTILLFTPEGCVIPAYAERTIRERFGALLTIEKASLEEAIDGIMAGEDKEPEVTEDESSIITDETTETDEEVSEDDTEEKVDETTEEEAINEKPKRVRRIKTK